MSESDVEITIDGIEAETDKAYLFIIDGENVWLPKRMIEMNYEEDIIVVPEWLALDKDLV